MADVVCDPPEGLVTDIGAAFLEHDAVAAQVGIGAGTTALTSITNLVDDRDPSDRFTALPNGNLQVNLAGHCVVDLAYALERTSAAPITDVYWVMFINATEVAWYGRNLTAFPTAGVVSALAPAGGGEVYSVRGGVATWLNAGDIIRSELRLTGAGTCQVLPSTLTERWTYRTAVHLGPGDQPYQGSVWP